MQEHLIDLLPINHKAHGIVQWLKKQIKQRRSWKYYMNWVANLHLSTVSGHDKLSEKLKWLAARNGGPIP